MPNKSTKTLLGFEARKKILKGVNKVYNAVRLTLGPAGKNALLPRTFNRGPRSTNDGVNISENILLRDPHERIAADFFKEGSKKTNELVGDGTTGTAVIGGHLVNKIFNKLPNENIPAFSLDGKSSTDVMVMRQEMKEAKEKVIEEIKKVAKPIKTLEELKKIALISIEDKKSADIVAEMVWELGVDNYVDTVEGYKGEIETETIKGMRFPAKVAARAFVNKPERYEMIAEDVPVLVTNYKLDNPFEVVRVLESVKVPKIAIVAPEFSQNVLQSIIATIKNGIFIYPVAVPSLRTAQLEDLAIYTKATLIDKDAGKKLDSVIKEDLGFAERIVVKDTDNKEDAVLIGGRGTKIKRGQGTLVTERCDMLKEQMKETKNNVAKEQLKRRIANMSSAVGVIRVGASTDAESLYLKLKIEDGVYSCKAALEEGYVKGGGLCLKEIAETMEENILTDSLKAPYDQIQKNGGKVKIGKDVIDAAKVVRLEIEHGVSIASQLITTDILVADEEEITTGEANRAIAKAINNGVYFKAKHEGMLKESEMEAEKDRMEIFNQALFNDLD